MDVLRVFKTVKKGSISSIEQRVRTQNAIYNTVKCAKMQRVSCSLSPQSDRISLFDQTRFHFPSSPSSSAKLTAGIPHSSLHCPV